MIIVFCDKNKLPYKEDYTFVYPNLDGNAIVRKYFSIDNLNTPSAGDMVVILGKLYKVFSTVFDYDTKIVYVTVEEI